jgi:hypothetical protein
VAVGPPLKVMPESPGLIFVKPPANALALRMMLFDPPVTGVGAPERPAALKSGWPTVASARMELFTVAEPGNAALFRVTMMPRVSGDTLPAMVQ